MGLRTSLVLPLGIVLLLAVNAQSPVNNPRATRVIDIGSVLPPPRLDHCWRVDSFDLSSDGQLLALQASCNLDAPYIVAIVNLYTTSRVAVVDYRGANVEEMVSYTASDKFLVVKDRGELWLYDPRTLHGVRRLEVSATKPYKLWAASVAVAKESNTVLALFYETSSMVRQDSLQKREGLPQKRLVVFSGPEFDTVKECKFDFLKKTEAALKVSLSADGELAAITGDTPNVYIVDLSSCGLVRKLHFPQLAQTAEFSRDGRLLAISGVSYSAKATDSVIIFNLKDGVPVAQLRGKEGIRGAIALSPSAELLVADSSVFKSHIFREDGSYTNRGFNLWQIPTGRLLGAVTFGGNALPRTRTPWWTPGLRFTSDGHEIVVLTPDLKLRFYSVPEMR